jgi:hypothetical protein
VQNEDILHNLLVSSDPYISSIRNIPKKKKKNELDNKVKLLLNLNNNFTDEENDYV